MRILVLLESIFSFIPMECLKSAKKKKKKELRFFSRQNIFEKIVFLLINLGIKI